MVTDTVVTTTTTTTTTEEKYRVLAPESMQETFMSDSEDEGGEDGEVLRDETNEVCSMNSNLRSKIGFELFS